jgi:TonB-dependent receptor
MIALGSCWNVSDFMLVFKRGSANIKTELLVERAIMQILNRESSASIALRSLRYGASCLALGSALIAAPSLAQDAEAPAEKEADDEIIVTGFKGSLQSAQAIKRKADVIVDSVSAEDIGALPDRSVTETLQRIPGVSIDRFAAGADPDHFSVEGSGVTIRGLSYVRSEINGREAFTVNNGRGLSFADVPSELLFGVDVFKSPSSDRIEGGISGVVNLRTRRPFDSNGLVISGSLENTYSDFREKSAPTFSALMSNRWETGIGDIGVLVSAVSSKLYSRADKLQVAGFLPRTLYANGNVISSGSSAERAPLSAPVQQVYFPSGADFGTQDTDRQRYGFSGALQWRSTDGALEATVQYLRSDARESYLENAVDIDASGINDPGRAWCNAGSLQVQGGDPGPCVGGPRAVPGTAITFGDDGIFTSGVITGPTGWRGDQFNNGFGPGGRTPVFALQSNNINRSEKKRYITTDISANLRWNISDRLSANFDYQHVKASVNALSAGLWTGTYQDAAINLNDGGIPTISFIAPETCSGPLAAPNACNTAFAGGFITPRHTFFSEPNASYLDPRNTYYHAAMDHAEINDGNSDTGRIDLSYELPENNWIKGIEIGGKYSKRDQTARFSIYNWGALSQQWGNGGPIWLDNPAVASLPGGGTPYVANTFPNYFGGGADSPVAGSGRLFYSGDGTQDYGTYSAFATSVVNAWITQGGGTAGTQTGGASGWVPLAQRPRQPGDLSGFFDSTEVNPSSETNKAAYLLAKIDHKFENGWNLTGSFGVRYTNTRRTSFGNTGTVLASPDSTTTAAPAPGTSLVVPSTFECTPRTDVINGVPTPYVPPLVCASTTPAQRAQIRQFFNGQISPTQTNLTYDYILPSLNLRLDTGNGLQFRVAYSKGIAPPDFGYVRSSFRPQSRFNDATYFPNQTYVYVEAGNPSLKPVTSNNFDFTTEWYFDNSIGRLTFAAFYKEIKGINVPGFFPTTLTNNGVTLPALLRTAVNSQSTGKIKGVELGYEQTYDFLPGVFSGLGLSANVTFLDPGNIEQGALSQAYPNLASAGNSANATTTDISKLPLTGLSKWNINIAPYYQKGPLEMRLAYNWRSRFLLTVQDVIFPYQPTFNNAAGYLDASISVAVTKQLKLGLQGTNLLDTITKTSAVIDRDATLTVPRSYFKNDRTFKIYARMNW